MPALIRLGSGVFVWVLHFGVVYGFTALACARDVGERVPWIVGGATLAASLILVGVIVREWPRRAAFDAWLAATIATLALVAVLLESVPVGFLAPCA